MLAGHKRQEQQSGFVTFLFSDYSKLWRCNTG